MRARGREKRRKVAPEGPAAPHPKPIAGPWVSAEDSLQAAANGGVKRVDEGGGPSFDVVLEFLRLERREQNQGYLGQTREVPLQEEPLKKLL